MSSLQHLAIEIVLGLALLVGAVLYLEHRGAEKCVAADNAAVTRQETHNEVKAATDAQVINQEAKTFETAHLDPISAPVARLCYYKAAAVPTASPAPGRTDAAPAIRAAPTPTPGPDIGPGVVKEGHLANVQVQLLQEYISRVCLVR